MRGRTKPAVVYLGLGANLGDRLANMRAAVLSLADHPLIHLDIETSVASLYETSAVGGPSGQPPYLNSALRISTSLEPHDLLDTVLSIEKTLGRTRSERWEARVIDIDLLLFADLVISDDTLSLPHPRMHERRFVLEPLAEIAGDFVHPVQGVTIARLANECRGEHPDQVVAMVDGPTWPRSCERVGWVIDPPLPGAGMPTPR